MKGTRICLATHVPRSFDEVMRDRLRTGDITVGGMLVAYRVYKGMSWEEAEAKVRAIVKELGA
jgi:hypothetical protein